MERKVYTIDNLDCANCAAKIESKLNDHPQVEEAVITFATRQLRLTAENPDALIPELQALARTVEPDAEILPREGNDSPAPPGASSGRMQLRPSSPSRRGLLLWPRPPRRGMRLRPYPRKRTQPPESGARPCA